MDCITLDETVMVSDPCYSDPTWCQIKLTNVLPGQYYPTCRIIEDPYWGERCSVLLVVHKDYLHDTLSWRNSPGEVGVDSGQAGIFSYDTYRNDSICDDIDSPVCCGFPSFGTPGEDWYEKVSGFTLSSEKWGSYYKGVVSSSGIGDGGYRCLLAKDKGKVVGIAIDYSMEKLRNKDMNVIIQEQLN